MANQASGPPLLTALSLMQSSHPLSPQSGGKDADKTVAMIANDNIPISVAESPESLHGRIQGLQQMLDAALNLARYDSGLFMDAFPKPPGVFLRSQEDCDLKVAIQIALFKAEQDADDKPLMTIFESKKTDSGDYDKSPIGYAIQDAILRGYWKTIPRIIATICQFNGAREKDRERLESAASQGKFKEVRDLTEQLQGVKFIILDCARNEHAPRGKSFQIFTYTAQKIAYLAASRSGQLEKAFPVLLDLFATKAS